MADIWGAEMRSKIVVKVVSADHEKIFICMGGEYEFMDRVVKYVERETLGFRLNCKLYFKRSTEGKWQRVSNEIIYYYMKNVIDNLNI